MITAKEAREKLESCQTDKDKKTLDDINNQILKAIDSGKNTTYYSNINEHIMKYLENCGYKVKRYSDYRDSGTIISW